jgi:uncharacterized LabA/DUF88 family protein
MIPKKPIANVFIDGQNLFYAAKDAFNYRQVNYGVAELAAEACRLKGWELGSISFYTGMPSPRENSELHEFWAKKLAVLGRLKIKTFTSDLKYCSKSEYQADGTVKTFSQAREKGIDVQIALDIVDAAYRGNCDAIILFSQDQDLRNAMERASSIAKENKRSLKLACAFPNSETARNNRGINGVDWIKLSRQSYDACIDKRHYHGVEHASDKNEARLPSITATDTTLLSKIMVSPALQTTDSAGRNSVSSAAMSADRAFRALDIACHARKVVNAKPT